MSMFEEGKGSLAEATEGLVSVVEDLLPALNLSQRRVVVEALLGYYKAVAKSAAEK